MVSSVFDISFQNDWNLHFYLIPWVYVLLFVCFLLLKWKCVIFIFGISSAVCSYFFQNALFLFLCTSVLSQNVVSLPILFNPVPEPILSGWKLTDGRQQYFITKSPHHPHRSVDPDRSYRGPLPPGRRNHPVPILSQTAVFSLGYSFLPSSLLSSISSSIPMFRRVCGFKLYWIQ